MTAPASLLHKTGSYPGVCGFAHWKNVSIVVWRSRAEGPAAQAIVDFTHELMKQYPLFSVLHIVEELSLIHI